MTPIQESLPLSDFLTYRVNVLSNLLNRQSERFLKNNHGIAIPDWRVIMLLAQAGPMSVRDLAILSKTDKALVSRVVSRLQKGGFVNSETHPHDARLVQVTITEHGMAVYHSVLPHAATRQNILMSILDEGEQAVLNQALEKLTEFAEDKGDDLF